MDPFASPGVGMLLTAVPPMTARGISREKMVSGPCGSGPETCTTRRRNTASAKGEYPVIRSEVGSPADCRSVDPMAGLQVPSASWRSSTRSRSVGGPPGGEVQESAKVIG